MDDKLSEGESKPKVTRSVARHMRRKRLLSARKAAEKDSSILTNVNDEQVNDSVNADNHRVAETLSKSKAKRLRKRSRIENGKGGMGINCKDKLEVANSPSRVKKASNEEVAVASSAKSTIETEILNTNNEYFVSNTIPNEHELFENEKNRKISENSKSADDSCRCIREDYESGMITIDSRRDKSSDLITNDGDNLRRIAERETLIDEAKIISDRIEESLVIRETEVSSIGEKITRASEDHAGESILVIKTPEVCTTSKQIVGKMNSQEKTRDEVKAEREAKKAAKAAAKNKVKVTKPQASENPTASQPVVTQKVCAPRGDVVDGEIIPMTNSIVLSSVFKQTPKVIAPLPFPESKHEEKSKAQLRAERRAKQETQRAAKQGQVLEKKEKPKVVNLITEIRDSTTTPEKIEEAKKIVKRTVNAHEVNLFKHLYHDKEQTLLNVPVVNSKIHPAIVRLGVQYAEKVIVGSNSRCVALLAAIKQLIRDFEKPSHSDFTRSLEASLQESSKYLNGCRPIAVSMHNALRHLKWQITQLPETTSDEEAKTKLANAIDTYIQEQIQLADKAISITIQTKISNGDVILTYGFSSLIYKILCDAHDAGRQFRVVVVDGRPWLEGREQLRRLAKHGLECSYVLINALSFIMPEVSKVFLGAHAILANGAVMSRVGTAQVALMAKSFNVPVLVACETHKSCERVQTDSIVYNELADADELAQSPMGNGKKTSLINWRGKKSLNLLNITYDVTPADLVTAVVTELAILPCTSVPVILRIKPSEI